MKYKKQGWCDIKNRIFATVSNNGFLGNAAVRPSHIPFTILIR